MNAGTYLSVEAEIVVFLESNGYIDAAGEFVVAKFEDAASLIALVNGVKAVLKKHGVNLPPKVDLIIQAVLGQVPLLELLLK